MPVVSGRVELISFRLNGWVFRRTTHPHTSRESSPATTAGILLDFPLIPRPFPGKSFPRSEHLDGTCSCTIHMSPVCVCVVDALCGKAYVVILGFDNRYPQVDYLVAALIAEYIAGTAKLR